MRDLDKISLNFILSTERSGSTLLSSILNNHQETIVTNEDPFSYFLYKTYKNTTNWNEKVIGNYINDFLVLGENKFNEQYGNLEDLRTALKQEPNLNIEKAIKLTYLNFFPQKNKSTVHTIIDKQIRHHYILKDLQLQFPKAKYIILVRDPRDVIAIKLKRAEKLKTKQDVYSASVNWNYTYSTILKHIKKNPANQLFFLKYEDLVTNPEATLKQICVFLKITFDLKMLSFHEEINKELDNFKSTSKDIFNSLHTGLTKEINSDKVGVWKKDLSKKQVDIIMTICHASYQKMGYDDVFMHKINTKNKTYFRALFFLKKKNFLRKLYNTLIVIDAFKFLKKHKKIKHIPG